MHVEVSSSEEKVQICCKMGISDSMADCILHYTNEKTALPMLPDNLYIMSVMGYCHSACLDQGFDYAPPWSTTFPSGQ